MVGIGGGGGGNYSPWIIGLAFTIYGSLNLFLNFFNKWVRRAGTGGHSLVLGGHTGRGHPPEPHRRVARARHAYSYHCTHAGAEIGRR